jgi:hypothetical protein
MKIKLAITSVFVALLLFGAGTIDASPISLGNASGFAALSLNGNVQNSNGTISGPVGVAAPGFSYTGNSSFTSGLYVNTDSTITLNGAAPSSVNQNASTNSYLSQAITDANSAAAQASASTPTSTFTTNPGTITQTAVGNYVYNIGGNFGNGTLTVSAPAGSTVIVNIASIPTNSQVTLNIAGGLTANNVIWNIQNATTLNQGGGHNVTGILLAPTSTVTINGGATFTGQVIAMAVTTTGSGLIIGTGLGPIVLVPEPSSLSIVAIGAAALLGHRFLRRRKSPG